MDKTIYAGVVTYNPEINLLKKNIEAICKQVPVVVIVDNGSSNFKYIKELIADYNLVIIRNKNNEGIAKALNKAMEYGKEKKYTYMLSLDQDSLCPDNYCEQMLKFCTTEKNIAVIAPVIHDRNVGIVGHQPTKKYGVVNTCITSGAITKISVWSEIGGYDNKLFIDSVDFEFCYRVRKKGYKIIQVSTVYLEHCIGDGQIVRFLFWKKRIISHSAFRCFYIAQNRIYYPRKHGLILYVVRGNYRNLKHLFQILIYEKNRRRKIRRFLEGWKNGYLI